MARFASWLLILLLLTGFLATAGYLLRQRARAGHGMPAGSVFDEGDDGLGELAHVLRRAGWKTVAVTRPAKQTPWRGLLILVEPGKSSLSDSAATGLLRWVEQGNTLLFASARTTPLHQALGAGLTTDDRGDPDSFARVEAPGVVPYREDVKELTVNRESILARPPGALVLWRVRGGAGALVVRHGKGRVVLVADPTLFTRRGMVRSDGEPRDDNVLFPLNVAYQEARGGTVYFDEYHHGFRSGTGFWSYLGYNERRWALLPVAFVVALALWRLAVRPGPARAVPRGDTTDAVAYAAGLARIYQRAGTRKLMARILVRDFLGALTKHLGLKRIALPALILAAWRQHHPDKPIDVLQGLLRGVGELRKGELDDRALLGWAQAFEQFRRQQLT